MKTEDKIRNGKVKYDIKKEVAKISALSAVKIHTFEYLTDMEILPSNQTKSQNKPNLHILLQEKLLKNKKKKQVDALRS